MNCDPDFALGVGSISCLGRMRVKFGGHGRAIAGRSYIKATVIVIASNLLSGNGL